MSLSFVDPKFVPEVIAQLKALSDQLKALEEDPDFELQSLLTEWKRNNLWNLMVDIIHQQDVQAINDEADYWVDLENTFNSHFQSYVAKAEKLTKQVVYLPSGDVWVHYDELVEYFRGLKDWKSLHQILEKFMQTCEFALKYSY